jgi:hypothetical protein
MNDNEYTTISIENIKDIRKSLVKLNRELGIAFGHDKEYQEYRDWIYDVYCKLREIKYRCEIIREKKK